MDAWKGTVDKVRGRLNRWTGDSLSMGGRLTIIKSVLSAIPLYNLSLMRLPKTVEGNLISLLRGFLWGSKEGEKKLAWVSWEVICKSWREGGLGVKDLGAFNKVLLGKWVWRFLTNKNSLWAKVVKSRFGEIVWSRMGERLEGRRTRRRGWWKSVVEVVEGREGKWFWDYLEVRLGNGEASSFWDGWWSGDQALKEVFPRLYQLSLKKEGTVAEMGSWEGGIWRWKLDWRRDLREWEKEGETNLLNFLSNFVLREDLPDRWRWRGRSGDSYTVKEAYKAIKNCNYNIAQSQVPLERFDSLWKTRAPHKAQLTAWRLLRDRLPSKDNLLKRGAIPQAEIDCCCCKREVESALHFFFRCPNVVGLWNAIIEWTGTSWASPSEVNCHRLCFASLLGYGKMEKRLGGLWICVIWVLWKWRNAVLFDEKEWDFRRIEAEIKCRYWSWCAARGEADLGLSYLSWARTPLAVTWNVK